MTFLVDYSRSRLQMITAGPVALTFLDGACIRAGRGMIILSRFDQGIGREAVFLLIEAGGLLLLGRRRYRFGWVWCFDASGSEEEQSQKGKGGKSERKRGEVHLLSLVDNCRYWAVQCRRPSARVKR